MKKSIFVIMSVLTLGLLSSTAFASDGKNFGSIEYAFRDYDGDTANRNGINLRAGREIAPGIKLDGKVEFRRENGSENTANRMEAGATYEIGYLFVRGAVGHRFSSGDSGNGEYGYYSLEPGVKLPVTKALSVSTSYRFRDSFKDDTNAETHQAKLGAEYKLTKTTAITGSVARSWGDQHYNSINVGYSIKF